MYSMRSFNWFGCTHVGCAGLTEGKDEASKSLEGKDLPKCIAASAASSTATATAAALRSSCACLSAEVLVAVFHIFCSLL